MSYNEFVKTGEAQACALAAARDCRNCSVQGYTTQRFFDADSTKGGLWVPDEMTCVSRPPPITFATPPCSYCVDVKLFDVQTRMRSLGLDGKNNVCKLLF